MSKNLRSLNKTAALRKRRGRDQGNQVEPPPGWVLSRRGRKHLTTTKSRKNSAL